MTVGEAGKFKIFGFFISYWKMDKIVLYKVTFIPLVASLPQFGSVGGEL